MQGYKTTKLQGLQGLAGQMTQQQQLCELFVEQLTAGMQLRESVARPLSRSDSVQVHVSHGGCAMLCGVLCLLSVARTESSW